mmetsp:Transcript_53407/g.116443  ORF Transcript_53407/g.116443 Transcript_53407/m.116443 type:complete len:244 (+) Transcript_53407:197-928(+)
MLSPHLRRRHLCMRNSVLVAGEAVAVRLEVDRNARVRLLSVGVDAALEESRAREAVLAEVLGDALGAAAAVVDENNLAIATQLPFAINLERRPCLPLLVRHPKAALRRDERLGALLLVAQIDKLQPVGVRCREAALQLERRDGKRHGRRLVDAEHMPAQVALDHAQLACRRGEDGKVELGHHQAGRDPAEIAAARRRLARTHLSGQIIESNFISFDPCFALKGKLFREEQDVRYACPGRCQRH